MSLKKDTTGHGFQANDALTRRPEAKHLQEDGGDYRVCPDTFTNVTSIETGMIIYMSVYLQGQGNFCTELNAAVSSCYTSPFQIHILPVLFIIRHILIVSL